MRRQYGRDTVGRLVTCPPLAALWRVVHRAMRPYFRLRAARASRTHRRVQGAALIVDYAADMGILGLNILAGGDYNRELLVQVVAELRPRYVVVMNNAGLCRELFQVFPGLRVIARHWPDDNSCRRHPDARARVAQLCALYPDPEIGLYLDNEPEYSPEMARYAATQIDELARRSRWGVAVNAGMGGPDKALWERDLLPILEALHRVNSTAAAGGRPEILLGWHEYFDFHDPFAPGYDPRKGDIWLNGRHMMALQVCEARGLRKPLCISTEGGADSLNPLYHGPWADSNAMSGDGYMNILEPLMNWYEVAAPYMVGYDLFAWDSGPVLGGPWRTYDTRQPSFVSALIAYGRRRRQKTVPEPVPIPNPIPADWRYGTLTADYNNVFVRTGPGTEYKDSGYFPTGGQLAYVAREAVADSQNKFKWLAFSLVSLNGSIKSGWVAAHLVRFEEAPRPVDPPVPEPPEPEPPAQTPADVTADVYRRLIAALSLYRDLMDTIARQAAFARDHTQEQIDDIEAVVAQMDEQAQIPPG